MIQQMVPQPQENPAAVQTGTQPPFASLDGAKLPYTIAAPTADRIMLFAGGKTSEGALTAADVFDTDLIGKARRMAQADELTNDAGSTIYGKYRCTNSASITSAACWNSR